MAKTKDTEILLSIGIGGVLARLASMIDKNGDLITAISLSCILIALFANWIRGRKENLVPSKIVYLEFLKFMLKDLTKYQKQVIPPNPFPLLRFNLRKIFPYKPVSDKELLIIKFKYEKWRNGLIDSLKFIFDEPIEKSVFPIWVIFDTQGGKTDYEYGWLSHMQRDFSNIDYLITLKSVNFSKKFEDFPEKLNEFKDYLK